MNNIFFSWPNLGAVRWTYFFPGGIIYYEILNNFLKGSQTLVVGGIIRISCPLNVWHTNKLTGRMKINSLIKGTRFGVTWAFRLLHFDDVSIFVWTINFLIAVTEDFRWAVVTLNPWNYYQFWYSFNSLSCDRKQTLKQAINRDEVIAYTNRLFGRRHGSLRYNIHTEVPCHIDL